ncbi:MAG TPA: D-alanyl-D-alanine carboxypeptidase, partial [Clostridiales bacterium]|nr:D-alanyl-D-alanine carboxypeptidase [Clostridiales bacterium]
MKKKFISILSLIVISIFAFNIKFTAVKTVNAENGLSVKCKSAIIMDYHSGSIIYAKNENARLPIASMTKLMALLLTFENVDNNNLSLDEKITVSKTASGMGGSEVFLEAGGEYLCSDLVKSVIVASANDATVALCERLYGSEENAVEEMNKRAKELNLSDTLYSNSTGLTKPTQYSSAKDVANLLKELCTHKQYFNYSKIWMDEIKHPSGNVTEISNTNKLVRFYEGCDGGKTGFTGEAGFCLSATAKRGAMRLISVVIGGENSKERFNGVRTMFNYAFSNYSE